MISQLSKYVSYIILGFFKRILEYSQDLLVFYGNIWVKNQGNFFFQQIFGQTTFVDKMATFLMETYGLGPSNPIMSRNCDTFFIASQYHFYTPYDPPNRYFFKRFVKLVQISQHLLTSWCHIFTLNFPWNSKKSTF